MQNFNLKRISLWAGIGIVVLLGLQSALVTINARRIDLPIAGLRFHGTTISGMDRAALHAVIQNELKKPLILVYKNVALEVYPSDVGVKVDVKDMMSRFTKVGREGSFWQRIMTQDAAFLGGIHQNISGSVSRTLLTMKLSQIQSRVEVDPTPLMPDFMHAIDTTIPGHEGVRIDTPKLAVLIMQNIMNPGPSISIPTYSVRSSHTEADLVDIRAQAKKLIGQALSIKSAGETFTLSTDDLKSFMTVKERPDPKDSHRTQLVLRLDETQLNRKLQDFAVRVEQKTNAEFDDHDARVAIYAQFFSGIHRPLEIPTGYIDPALLTESIPTSSLPRAEIRASHHALQTASVLDTFAAALPVAPNSIEEKFVYLTFDDGPNAVYHPLLLDILKKYGVQATFFLVGTNAQKYDAVTKRTLAEGHSIGNHTLNHAFLPKLSHIKIDKEIKDTTTILQSFTDKTVDLFRPPYGGVNPYVKSNAKQLKLRLILWNVDPQDWSEPTVDELIHRVISKAHNGSDILLHSNHLVTVKALPAIIETLQSQGYGFKTFQ